METMKSIISLSVSKDNEPIIRVLHYDKSDFAMDLILGNFIKQAAKNGIAIEKKSGSIGPGFSVDQYEITINKQ